MIISASHDKLSEKASLAPLILFAASPGTITGVITLAAAHTKLMFPVTALVAVCVATVRHVAGDLARDLDGWPFRRR